MIVCQYIKFLGERIVERPDIINNSYNKQLVAAYLIGMPVYDSLFITLKPCETSEETGFYVLRENEYARV